MIKGEYDVLLLVQMGKETKKKLLFHQDNARVHLYTCALAMTKLHQIKFELLPHPLYSPD